MAGTLSVPSPHNFDSFIRGVSGQYSKNEGQDILQFTKKKLGREYDEIDDVYSMFKKLHKQGRIEEGETNLLESYAEKTTNKQKIKDLIKDFNAVTPQKKDKIVGRENDLKQIDKTLNSKFIRGINLFGASGVGKTTLAQAEAKAFCESNRFMQNNIDLRNIEDINKVYFAFLECFKLPLFETDKDINRNIILSHLKELPKQLLIIDNVEQLLSYESSENRQAFIGLISDVMASPASKKGDLKIMLTSRVQFEEPKLKVKGFSEILISQWKEEVSTNFIAQRSKSSALENEKNTLLEIANLCKNTPYLLDGFSQMIREGSLTSEQILQQIQDQLSNPDIPEKFACINLIFESLPTDHIKQVAIKVALFRRQFAVSAAQKVADSPTPLDANFDLEILARHKLLSVVDSDDKATERMYDIHAIFHEFVDTVLCTNPKYQDTHKAGQRTFFHHFTDKLMRLSKLIETDFITAYRELGIDRPNYDLTIDIASQKEVMGFLLFSDEYHKTALMSALFEALKDQAERRKLYHNWGDVAEREGQWLACAQMRCWESIQEADLSGPQEGLNVLEKAESCLQKAKPDTSPDKFKVSEGLYHYCHGRIYWLLGESIPDKKESETAQLQSILELEQSLNIHRQRLGDHTQTARTLNLIGNCYMAMDKPEEGLKRYQEAMEMKRRLVGSDRHWEMPTYYNQMAAVYERFGALEEEKFWLIRSKKKVKEHYTKAKQWIEKAIDLQTELEVSETEHTATFQRNLANILVALGEYDNALNSAKESHKRRQEQLGTHPETARILYLIGIINEWRKDKRAALEAYEKAFDVEESLPSNNHSVVRYLIRNRFQVMCKILKEQKKLEQHKARIKCIDDIEEKDDEDMDEELQALLSGMNVKSDEIIEEDSLAASQTNADALDEIYEPFTTTITVDATGRMYTKYGIYLDVPPNTFTDTTELELTIHSTQSIAGNPASSEEWLVSNIVGVGPSSLTCNEPMTLTLHHSASAKNPGYEVVLKEFNSTEGLWEDSNLDITTSHDATYGSSVYSHLPRLQVELWQPTTIAIVIRLITDHYDVTPQEGNFVSSACRDVCVKFPRGAVKKKFNFTMKVHPIPESVPHSAEFIPCPLLQLEGFEDLPKFAKPVTIRLPHPSPGREGSIRLLCWRRDGDSNSQEWVDISHELVSSSRTGSVLEIQVLHFSRLWPWLAIGGTALLCAQASKMYSYLGRGPELSAYFAAYKMRNETQDNDETFHITLILTHNTEQDQIDDRMEGKGFAVLGYSTSEKMRAGDKAFPQFIGGLEQSRPAEVAHFADYQTFHGRSDLYDRKKLRVHSLPNQKGNDLIYYSDADKTEPPLCYFSLSREITSLCQEDTVEYYGILVDDVIKDLPVDIRACVYEWTSDDLYPRTKNWDVDGAKKFLVALPRYSDENAENCFNAITDTILKEFSCAEHVADLLKKGREIIREPLTSKKHHIGQETSLLCVAEKCPICWKRLGRKLQLEEKVIRNCEADYSREGFTEQCYQMLITWVERKGSSATLERLLDVLRISRCSGAAQSLAMLITEKAKTDLGLS